MRRDLNSGKFAAVKRMPISWTGYNQEDFLKRHAEELEMPWVDVAIAPRPRSSPFSTFQCWKA